MRPHDEWRLWPPPPTAPSPCRRPSVGPARRNPAGGNRLATGPGNCSPPLGGLFPRPRFASRYRRGSAGIRGKLRRSRPGEQFRHPPAGCSSTPVSRVGAAEDMRAAENSGRSRSERFATPPGGLFLPARPGCRIPHLPSSGSHPIRYPTASLISIGRQRVPIHRGAMMPRSCSSI